LKNFAFFYTNPDLFQRICLDLYYRMTKFLGAFHKRFWGRKQWEPLDISTNLAPTARSSYAAIYLHNSFLSVFRLIPRLLLLFSFGGICPVPLIKVRLGLAVKVR
jgi:hypothetical protein